MSLPVPSDRILNIYLTIRQYPILRTRIRARMRTALFERGIISREDFEADVREKAVQSQAREGFTTRMRRRITTSGKSGWSASGMPRPISTLPTTCPTRTLKRSSRRSWLNAARPPT